MKLAPAEHEQIPAPDARESVHSPSRVVSLSNGAYRLRLSEAGSGHSRLESVAITRWTGDELVEADGFHIYLRDLEDDFVWSAGYQPTRVTPAQYEFRAAHNVAEISRLDRDIECRVQVFVAPHGNFEVRLCQLANHGQSIRRIELTSYLEWVLGLQEADSNHPAFSKLFVETEFCEKRQAVFSAKTPA